jgi:hypothetical protein
MAAPTFQRAARSRRRQFALRSFCHGAKAVAFGNLTYSGRVNTKPCCNVVLAITAVEHSLEKRGIAIGQRNTLRAGDESSSRRSR